MIEQRVLRRLQVRMRLVGQYPLQTAQPARERDEFLLQVLQRVVSVSCHRSPLLFSCPATILSGPSRDRILTLRRMLPPATRSNLPEDDRANQSWACPLWKTAR
jgi:hypothetical protein